MVKKTTTTTDTIQDQLEDLMKGYNKQVVPFTVEPFHSILPMQPCPTCGTCPTCGRRAITPLMPQVTFC